MVHDHCPIYNIHGLGLPYRINQPLAIGITYHVHVHHGKTPNTAGLRGDLVGVIGIHSDYLLNVECKCYFGLHSLHK